MCRSAGWTASLMLGLMTCAAGCPPPPADAVRVRVGLPQPLPDGPAEAVVRAAPGVTDVEVHEPGASYTLTGKRIPGRNSVSFRSPELAGAWGWVGLSVNPDRTTMDLSASAMWPRDTAKPNAAEKRRALQLLERLVGQILLLEAGPHPR